MRTALALPALLFVLTGCVGYPRVWMTGRAGQAVTTGGRPKTLKAAIVRRCETLDGESETVKKEKTFRTDAEGRYEFRIIGTVWNWKNLLTGAYCRGRLQLYDCQEVCREVDLVDLEMLGKYR